MPKSNPIKIIVIVGPTASGKSDLALRLALWLRSGRIAKQFGINGAEIISADSRQVYRGMDIGTGKISKKEQKIVPHHLIDVASPKKQFTADDFKKLGEKAIKKILAKNKVLIIVGGTGFYIDVLLGRMSIAEVCPDKKLRTKLEKQSAEQLFKQLHKLDPRHAKTIDRHNKRRLVRALEIVITTGKPVPRFKIHDSRFTILWLGLNPKNLKEGIKTRLDARLKQGMIREVETLHKQGVSWKRLENFGLEYRWISRYLIQKLKIKNQNDKSKLKNFRETEYYDKLLKYIIKYSKRQMTWFKRNKEIHWLVLHSSRAQAEGSKTEEITKEAKDIYSSFFS